MLSCPQRRVSLFYYYWLKWMTPGVFWRLIKIVFYYILTLLRCYVTGVYNQFYTQHNTKWFPSCVLARFWGLKSACVYLTIDWLSCLSSSFSTLQCSTVELDTVIQQQDRTSTSIRTRRSSAKVSQGSRFVLATWLLSFFTPVLLLVFLLCNLSFLLLLLKKKNKIFSFFTFGTLSLWPREPEMGWMICRLFIFSHGWHVSVNLNCANSPTFCFILTAEVCCRSSAVMLLILSFQPEGPVTL